MSNADTIYINLSTFSGEWFEIPTQDFSNFVESVRKYNENEAIRFVHRVTKLNLSEAKSFVQGGMNDLC